MDQGARTGACGPAPPPHRDRRSSGSPCPPRTPPSCDLSCAGNRGRNSRSARCRPAPCRRIRAGLCRRGGQGSDEPGGTPGLDSAGRGERGAPDCAPRSRRPGGRGAPKLDPTSCSPSLGTPGADPGHGWGLLLELPREPQLRAALHCSGVSRGRARGFLGEPRLLRAPSLRVTGPQPFPAPPDPSPPPL